MEMQTPKRASLLPPTSSDVQEGGELKVSQLNPNFHLTIQNLKNGDFIQYTFDIKADRFSPSQRWVGELKASQDGRQTFEFPPKPIFGYNFNNGSAVIAYAIQNEASDPLTFTINN
ncbi:hypothetical protein ACW9IB_22140 [Pseudomonas sp. SDO524_S393]